MKNSIITEVAKFIQKSGKFYAEKTVGRSYPISFHEVRIPDVLKKSVDKPIEK